MESSERARLYPRDYDLCLLCDVRRDAHDDTSRQPEPTHAAHPTERHEYQRRVFPQDFTGVCNLCEQPESAPAHTAGDSPPEDSTEFTEQHKIQRLVNATGEESYISALNWILKQRATPAISPEAIQRVAEKVARTINEAPITSPLCHSIESLLYAQYGRKEVVATFAANIAAIITAELGSAISVGGALAELRTMFPNDRIFVESSAECYGDSPTISAKIIMPGLRFTGKTLSETMQAVRDWKEKQDG